MLINFRQLDSSKTPLDERAQRLESEMEMANLNAILMELPDPKPATFLNLPHDSEKQNNSLSNGKVLPGSWSQSQSLIAGSSPLQEQSASTLSPLLQGAGHPLITENLTEPTLDNLAKCFEDLCTQDRRMPYQNDIRNFSSERVKGKIGVKERMARHLMIERNRFCKHPFPKSKHSSAF